MVSRAGGAKRPVEVRSTSAPIAEGAHLLGALGEIHKLHLVVLSSEYVLFCQVSGYIRFTWRIAFGRSCTYSSEFDYALIRLHSVCRHKSLSIV